MHDSIFGLDSQSEQDDRRQKFDTEPIKNRTIWRKVLYDYIV